ncbi:hypothetical protein FRB91_001047 [Serendipita sp. 411]|nr:hypothetical protein FRC15_000788 [Serendipita sp. 397]KAG8815991.1 hypothetical protein FRC19_000641 [Serendipita sp. 401]KAG8856265.1 hypothetical protein FRB91_001047 [Serendipita sp. 411]
MSTLVLNPLSTTPMLARTSSPYRMVIRRNALVPLPLLPPPPANTSVTSVRVIHNVMPGEDCPPSPVPPSPSESPTSPTQASFYVSAKQKACSMKRPRHQRRRSCPSPCGPPNGQSTPIPIPYIPARSNTSPASLVTAKTTSDSVVINTPYSMFGGPRRPRSTVVVTVRFNNHPPIAEETDRFNNHPPMEKEIIRSNNHPPVERERPFHRRSPNGVIPPPRPPPTTPPPPRPPITPGASLKPAWNKPRVSSGLALDDPDDHSVISHGALHVVPPGRFVSSSRRYIPPTEIAIMRNTNSRNMKKTGSRLAMLRWALLNQSGPEIGRRILGMGVRLAQEVWEAERQVEEEDGGTEKDEKMGQSSHEINPAGETEGKHWFEKVDIHEEYSAEQMDEANEATPSRVDDAIANVELEKERERIAEECIRELEDMEIDVEQTTSLEGENNNTLQTIEEAENATMDFIASDERSEDSSSDGSSSDDDEPVSDEETSSMDVDVASEAEPADSRSLSPLQVQFNLSLELQLLSPKTADNEIVGSPTNTRHHISIPIPQTWFNQLAL